MHMAIGVGFLVSTAVEIIVKRSLITWLFWITLVLNSIYMLIVGVVMSGLPTLFSLLSTYFKRISLKVFGSIVYNPLYPCPIEPLSYKW